MLCGQSYLIRSRLGGIKMTISTQALNITDIHSINASWCEGSEPLVLSDIFDAGKSVVVWKRPNNTLIQGYFSAAFKALGMGVRGVFSMASLKKELAPLLPDSDGKQAVIDDIFLLSDMLTTLFDCDSVGVRLVPLSAAMCPSFHVDNIPVRLVNTYLGEGTQWLPQEVIVSQDAVGVSGSFKKNRLGQYYKESDVHQMRAFDVGLLKGKAWQGHEEFAAVHRSCPVEVDDKRVLLTLDPM